MPPGRREQTDRDALEVRADRSRRTVTSFMRSGSGQSTFKAGILPGLLAGIAVAVVAAIVVGGASVAATAMGPSAGQSGSPTVRPSLIAATTSLSPTPTPAATPSPSRVATPSGKPTPVVTAAGKGTVHTLTVVFAFNSTTQGWTASTVGSGSTFTALFDGGAGKAAAGSVVADLAGESANGATGTLVWSGTWSQLKVPEGASVLGVAASYQCRLDDIGGGKSSDLRQTLDLIDDGGAGVAALVKSGSCGGLGSWVARSGQSALVPDYLASSDAQDSARSGGPDGQARPRPVALGRRQAHHSLPVEPKARPIRPVRRPASRRPVRPGARATLAREPEPWPGTDRGRRPPGGRRSAAGPSARDPAWR